MVSNSANATGLTARRINQLWHTDPNGVLVEFETTRNRVSMSVRMPLKEAVEFSRELQALLSGSRADAPELVLDFDQEPFIGDSFGQ